MDIHTACEVAYKNGVYSVIVDVRNYLLNCIEEWYKLDDRRFEPANIQVYNHVRACLDDLEEYENKRR